MPTSPAFGQRFTVVANHFKSKSCSGASGGDLDANDGQGCFAATRTAQAARLLTWVNATVVPAAGDPDVMLLGDFNSYPLETATTTLTAGGFTDLQAALLGPTAYSYLFDGQLGHLDYAFTSASLTAQIAGVAPWHINADESDLFDYNDEIKDVGEAAFEEKSDGSALVPPRVLFQPATPYRASDHDPVLVGLFRVSDLVVTNVDSPDPVLISQNLTYTITVTNNGPEAANTASWSDTLPAGVDLRVAVQRARMVLHHAGGGSGRHRLLHAPVVRGGQRPVQPGGGARSLAGRLDHRRHRHRHLRVAGRRPRQRERHGQHAGAGARGPDDVRDRVARAKWS